MLLQQILRVGAACDLSPPVEHPDQPDSDGDGAGDACDVGAYESQDGDPLGGVWGTVTVAATGEPLAATVNRACPDPVDPNLTNHAAYGGIGLGYLLSINPVLGAMFFSVASALGIGLVLALANLVVRDIANLVIVAGNRDRIADLDTEGWVCTGSRLRQDTGWKPE